MLKIVVALGGNALGNNVEEQKEQVKFAATSIVDLVAQDHQVVVAHGNGPQVGKISKQMNVDETMPLPECTAMSQGYIGYHLQQAIGNELSKRGINKEVASILTQVVVNSDDQAFSKPTKPIGSYYDEKTAKNLIETTGDTYAEDAGRGWRQVVASPKPIDIKEKAVIKQLTQMGVLTIACGGGGVPVTFEGKTIAAVNAVIDKDFAAAKLAELISADILFILTAVDRVKINFGQPNEESLVEITTSQAYKYIDEGHFAPGSMLPKVEASLAFVESGINKKAIICSLEMASLAILGESGTRIIK